MILSNPSYILTAVINTDLSLNSEWDYYHYLNIVLLIYTWFEFGTWENIYTTWSRSHISDSE